VAVTLIVVEDDDDVRELAVNTLREAGFNVLQAMNGGIALILLQEALPVDLLFTDIVMPGEPDGVALAERAKELRPNLRVLYTTGFAGASRFRQHAIHGKVLGKPYRSRQLASEVEQLLSG